MADQKIPKEKWKPEFVSPGQAWMDHVERHHNAGAATPEYLKEKSRAIQQIQQAAENYKKQLQNPEPKLDKYQDKANDKASEIKR